jgi:uncharacterized protein
MIHYIHKLRRRAQGWLITHPRTRRLLQVTGCLRRGTEAGARGVAVGLFIALTPTVGIQTLLLAGICMLSRANFLAAFAVSWVANPFTIGPLYWLFHQIGESVFKVLFGGVWALPGAFVDGVGDELLFTAIGSLLVAVPAAIAGYWITHGLRAIINARRRGRQARIRMKRAQQP